MALVAATRPLAAEPASTNNLANQLKQLTFEELMGIKVDTVIAASKREQKITEAPSAVSIVTKEDIKQFGYRTLADILNDVRGLFVTSDRAYSGLGVRGVNRPGDYGGRVLLLIDGHRMNEPLYDSLFIDHDFPLDVDLIDRVEVIRGPGSALYGDNAFFGVINVVTRKGRDLNGAEASAAGGAFDTYGGRFSYGQQFTNGVELLLSGTYFDTQGQKDLTYDDPTIPSGPHPDYQRSKDFYGSVSYGGFTLWGLYGQRTQSVPPGAYDTILTDPATTIEDTRAVVELKYERNFEHDWSVMARAYYDYYGYVGNYVYDYMDPLNPGLTLNRDQPHADFLGGEIQVSKMIFDRHHLTFGVEGRDDAEVNQLNYDVSPATTYLDKTTSAYSCGLYGQGEIALLPNLTLDLGARFDQFSTFGSTFNPRGGLIYHPWSRTTVKALYGQAYRAPNAFESDFENTVYAANHDLRPETIHSYELVWEQDLGHHLRLSSSLYYNQINDLITQVDETDNPAVGRFIFRNTDKVNVKGGEVELEGRWENGFRTRLSYAYADARDGQTDAWLANSPRHLGKFQMVMPLYRDKVSLSFALQAASDRLTARGNSNPGHIVGNLTLFSRKLVKNLEVSASIYNVWDAKYSDPVNTDFVSDTVPQDRRSFRVKATYKF
jgi:iron complex outermembrane receptor protein